MPAFFVGRKYVKRPEIAVFFSFKGKYEVVKKY
jgi:hypothetical protein